MAKLLVLGGTVFLGRHVVADALKRGDEVTVVSRGLHGAPPPDGVRWLRGDRRTDLPALLGAEEWDAAVDTSAYAPQDAEAAVAVLAGRLGHLSLVTTCNVYPGWPAEPVSEDSEIWQDGEGYGPDKARCERIAEAAMPGRVAHLRAGLLCGPGDAVLRLPWWLRRIARGGDVVAPGTPDRTVQLIDARDAAAWALRLGDGRVAGAYNMTAPPGRTTFGEVLDAAIAATGSDARVHSVPVEVLLAAGVEPWDELPLWGPVAEGFRGTWAVATDRARAAGLRCRPVAVTVADTWAWLRDGGAERLDEWGSHARPRGLAPEREAELLRRVAGAAG